MAIDLTSLKQDTSSIIDDWEDTVTWFVATTALVTNGGGERRKTWASHLTTTADVQVLESVFTGTRRRASITEGGAEFQAELMVVHRQGVNVAEGMRFTFQNKLQYARAIDHEEDHLMVFCSRKTRDDG